MPKLKQNPPRSTETALGRLCKDRIHVEGHISQDTMCAKKLDFSD